MMDPSTDRRLMPSPLPRRMVWEDLQTLVAHCLHGAALGPVKALGRGFELNFEPMWCPGERVEETVVFRAPVIQLRWQDDGELQLVAQLHRFQTGDPWHHWVQLSQQLRPNGQALLEEMSAQGGEHPVHRYDEADVLPCHGTSGTLSRMVVLPLARACLRALQAGGRGPDVQKKLEEACRAAP